MIKNIKTFNFTYNQCGIGLFHKIWFYKLIKMQIGIKYYNMKYFTKDKIKNWSN